MASSSERSTSAGSISCGLRCDVELALGSNATGVDEGAAAIWRLQTLGHRVTRCSCKGSGAKAGRCGELFDFRSLLVLDGCGGGAVTDDCMLLLLALHMIIER